jgi:hypothetical protein
MWDEKLGPTVTPARVLGPYFLLGRGNRIAFSEVRDRSGDFATIVELTEHAGIALNKPRILMVRSGIANLCAKCND